MYQIVVKRGEEENSRSVLRRFSREAKSLGIVKKMRKRRFEKRTASDNVRRKQKLHFLTKMEKRQQLVRLGKVSETRTHK